MGSGYLKNDLLKGKIEQPRNTDVKCPNLKENLFRNELLNASKLVSNAVAQGKSVERCDWGGGSMYRPCRIKTSSGDGKGMREED